MFTTGVMELVAIAMLLAPIALLIGTLFFLVPWRRKNYRACPYCAESIRAAAQVCRYCGRDVTPTLDRSRFQEMISNPERRMS